MGTWTPLPNGRFLVVLKREGEGDITRYDMVLNWTAVLERKVAAAR